MKLISNSMYISAVPFISNEYIAHHGIKGMRWGIRRYQNEDGSLTEAGKKRYLRETDRTAKKDAKEYVRAKMYYGEGAGTRRKMINKTIEQRRRDPAYSERLDYWIERQDVSKAASRARTERRSRDAVSKTVKTARGITNMALHTGASVGASAATIYGIARMTGLDQKVVDLGKELLHRYFK